MVESKSKHLQVLRSKVREGDGENIRICGDVNSKNELKYSK
jgi:hypothetical protein